MSFIDELQSAFQGKLTEIDLPEEAHTKWGWPKQVFATPFTMGDRKRVQKFIKTDEAEAYIRVCCMKLCDENGARLMEDGDKFKLEKLVPAWLIANIGDQILASESTEEEEEKK